MQTLKPEKNDSPTVSVTGASSGMGKEIAKQLLQDGLTVAGIGGLRSCDDYPVQTSERQPRGHSILIRR